LPTEAEWEYACRAGTTTRFSFGDDEATLARYSIYQLNSNSGTAQVGTRLCNAWGLFDMHGNVHEWCWDRFDNYEPNAEVQDPLGGTKDSRLLFRRVYRGGSWASPAEGCESSHGNQSHPWIPYHTMGFRVAADASSRQASQASSELDSQHRNLTSELP
jgi:formylglycine-generating enzyme required for sulfatase activity